MIPQVSVICIAAGISIADISVGSVYFHDCPAQYLITYYLIISGVTSLLLLILSFFLHGNGAWFYYLYTVFKVIFGLFQLAFFIAGNVWIYSIYAPNYTDPTAANYCHKVLYLYAFWITNVAYILLGLSLCIACCMSFGFGCTVALQEVSV
ncbi:transmembrane protein 272-like isoform X2 [Lissotriton helveticus]